MRGWAGLRAGGRIAKPFASGAPQPKLGSHAVPLITVDGHQFRDLNRDGKLEPFEDWRKSSQVRADDLAGDCRWKRRLG